ncbi:MAG: hypothetical protein CMP56_04660 [Flavobacteriales bacterium]|nr:hypothetical protein [Flavobacteriales bacterium]
MKKILVRIIFFFVFISFIHAQENDVQSWSSFELGCKPMSNLSLTYNNGVRFAEDVSEMSRYFFDFKIKRKHSRLLSYAVGYRYLFDFNKSDNATNIHRKKRWYLDFYLKQAVSQKIKFSSRTRFQSQMSVTFLNHSELKNKLRQKCKFLYNFQKSDLAAFFSIEAFFLLDDNVEKLRYQVWCLKSISKKTNLSLSYMIQQELIDSDLFFVIRSKLSYDF